MNSTRKFIGTLPKTLRFAGEYGLYSLLLISLISSFFIWIAPNNLPKQQLAPSGLPLQSLLFKSGSGMTLFRIQGTKNFFTDKGGIKGSPRTQLLSMNHFLVQTETGAQVLIASTNRNYFLPSGPNDELISANPSGSLVFSTSERESSYLLTVRSRNCPTNIEIPLMRLQRSPTTEKFFSEWKLPKQRILKISPFETHIVVLDHVQSFQILLANLIDNTTQTLSVPTFSSQQVHFSPAFTDKDTLVFSVIDGNIYATVSYDILEQSYEIVSGNFSDRILSTTSGSTLFLQSFYDEGRVNVPFGSIALYGKTRSLAGQTAAAESGVPEGTLRILQWNPGAEFIEKFSLSFTAFSGFFEFNQHIEPLLDALGVPALLKDEYAKRSRVAEASHRTLELMDAFW